MEDYACLCIIAGGGDDLISAEAVTKMPHRQSAFLDGDCYFVAVTAWMMTANRRCHCGECNPAAVSR
jgi:hypothetical protein